MDNQVIEPVRTAAINVTAARNRRELLLAWIMSFRLEELFAVLAISPLIYYTSKGYFIFRAQGHIPEIFLADINRVFWITVIAIIGTVLVRFKPQWELLHSILPFTYCLAIYTNLHDTIPFMNPHDVHFTLIGIDQWLFGVQPSIWTEQFVRPWLTEIFSFCYWSYFLLIPLLPAILYYQKRYAQFREVIISTIFCLYAGYILYVIFPAISPSYVLKDLYSVPLIGTPLTNATMGFANRLPSDVRDAFPSLHAGIALLSLLFAWKYLRRVFWVILPICIGLVLSTIYLRHHYFIDLPAGFVLGYLGFKYSGPIDSWWRSKQSGLKFTN